MFSADQLVVWLPIAVALLLINGMMFFQVWRSRSLCWRYAGGRRLLVDVLLADIWAMCELGMLYAHTLTTALFFYRLNLCIVAIIPIIWLSTLLPGEKWTLNKYQILVLVSLVPMTTVVLALTSDYHDMLIVTSTFAHISSRASLVISHGPWFQIHTIYTYLISAWVLVLSVVRARSKNHLPKGVPLAIQVAGLILLALSIPFVASVSGVLPPLTVSLCVIAFWFIAYASYAMQSGDIRRAAEDVLVSALPDALLAIDQDGLVLDMNANAEAITGVRLAYALGRPATQVFSIQPELVAAIKDGTFSRGRRLALGSAYYEIAFVGKEELGPDCTLYALTDVTNQVHIQQEQRQSQAMLRAFLDQSSEAIAILDETATVISWNPAMALLTGISVVSACGQPFGLIYADLVATAHSGGQEYQELLASLKGQNADALQVEHEIRGADGRIHFLQTGVFRFDTPVGVRIAHISIDITDIRAAQKHREILLQDLERASHELDRLRKMLPVCAWCGNVRDDEGYWKSVEEYVSSRFGATVSLSICPECQAAIRKALEKNDDGNIEQALLAADIHPRFEITESALTDALTLAGLLPRKDPTS